MHNRLFLRTLALGFFVAGYLASPSSYAMPRMPVSASAIAQYAPALIPVDYVCRRIWSCDYYGYGWRRFRGWQPDVQRGWGDRPNWSGHRDWRDGH